MTTLEAIEAHAVAEYPREACGLVVVVKGREQYRPCRNMADAPGEHFRLDPSDYAAAEDAGEITAVVHSHPDAAAAPSEADRVGCEASGLPWLIVAVHGGRVAGRAQIEPCGYIAPLVGRTWSHGTLDCWALVRDWYARELGVALPSPPRADGWWNDGHSDLYAEAAMQKEGFRKLAPDETLLPGDVILMQIRARNGVPNHAAVYLGDGLMLHHLAGRLSSRDVYGGYWQEMTHRVMRYAHS